MKNVKIIGVLVALCVQAFAIGGPSGAKLDYSISGKIGEVVLNPYDIAPLTAVIKDGGYVLENAKVTIKPKKNGHTIAYSVSNENLKLYGGIPVFGLYANYANVVDVEYTKIYKGKKEKIKESYKIPTAGIYVDMTGFGREGVFFDDIKVNKVEKAFSDRLYLVNNMENKSGKGTKVVWNNPAGGALEWNYYPSVFIIDTKGEVRWYLMADRIYNLKSAFHAGVMMGFKQNNDGALSWGYGQRYVKYDIMGREIFNRELPSGYIDFSHSMDNMQNGHYLLRVANANYKRADGKNVRTVRDVIVEVDESGKVVDDWRMYDILDPYRDNVIKVLDQGAVCLNIDASQAGKTLSADELAKLDASDRFGDIVGSGPGRNWAHINSVDWDSEDDSIIISSRHQSAIIKIGRDKKVKWILGAKEGWKGDLAKKVLQPVDSKGNKIECENSKCPGYLNDEGGFDFTWTQHTAFKIDSKSKGNIIYVSAFDNGDSRGMEQPALPTDKYSRAVVYKIDQKKMTVEQVWEYGKSRGFDWYSSVTSLTEYQKDKDSIFTYYATAGMQFDIAKGMPTGSPKPVIAEFKWGASEPSVEIRMDNAMGYQAYPFSLNKAFGK